MKIKRITWFALPAGLLLLCFALLAAGLAYLRTHDGSRYLLKYAQDVLADQFRTHVEYSEGSIDLLHGLHLKNLKITRDDDAMQARILIADVDLHYSISFWRKAVEIHELKLVRPSMTLKLRTASARDPVETPDPNAPSALQSLEALIRKPPLRLKINDISVEDLDLVFEQTLNGDLSRMTLADFNFKMGMTMIPERLTFTGSIATGRQNEISVIQSPEVKPHRKADQEADQKSGSGAVKSPSAALTALNVGFDGGLDWTFDIHHEAGSWLYELRSPNLNISLKNFLLQSTTTTATAATTATTEPQKTPHENSPSKTDLRLADARFESKIEIRAKTNELFTADPNSIDTAGVSTRAQATRLSIEQSPLGRGPRARQSIGTVQLTLTSAIDSATPQEIRTKLDFTADGIEWPTYLNKPSRLILSSDTRTSRGLDDIQARLQASLNDIPLVHGNVNLLLPAEPQDALRFSGAVALFAKPELARVLKPAATLKQTGPLQADLDFEGQRDSQGLLLAKLKTVVPSLRLPSLDKPVGLELTGETRWDESKNELDWSGQLKHMSGDFSGLPVRFTRPFTLSQRIALRPGNESIHLDGELPALVLEDIGKMNGTRLTLDARSPSFSAAKHIDVTMNLQQSDVVLEPGINKEPSKLPKISGLTGQVEASVSNGSVVTIDSFNLSTAQPYTRWTAQANGDLNRKTASARMELDLRLSEQLSALAGQKLQGEVRIPATLSLLNGQELTATGFIEAKNLRWSKEPFAASGISGRIPFTEKLKWDGKHISFTKLIAQEPFERVDFERIRPLLQGTEQLQIERLRWKEKSYGPFLGFFSLRQNMLFAHQFDVDVGPGKVHGQMFFDAHPKNMEIGLLSRLTGLDLLEILPREYLTRLPKGQANLSGRTGVVLNLNRSTIDGRLDITEIGGPQLIALINVLDPQYEDEKMNKIRSLLQVGYPTGVALAFAEGYLNLDVTLAVLGMPRKQSIRAIPISSFLSSTSASLMKQTEKGPLK